MIDGFRNDSNCEPERCHKDSLFSQGKYLPHIGDPFDSYHNLTLNDDVSHTACGIYENMRRQLEISLDQNTKKLL